MRLRKARLLAIFLAVAISVTFIPTFSFAATSLKAPAKVKATVVSDTAVQVSWGKVKGAKGYLVYQKSADTKYKLAKKIKKGATVKWVSKNLTTDTKYSFKIKAFKGKKKSKFSKEVSATPYAGVSSFAEDLKPVLSTIKDNVEWSHQLCRTMAYDPSIVTNKDWLFRHAGSDGEHKAANYLEQVMKDIGLQDVEQVEVLTDKWQFDSASLTLKNDGGTTPVDIDVKQIVPQASSAHGEYTGDLVYLNHGYEADYEAYYDAQGLTGADRNMNGKIVLADINQYRDFWISNHYIEAFNQGADGIIVYSDQYTTNGQYGPPGGEQTGIEKWDEACQCQDLCTLDHGIPCMAISRADGLKLIEGINAIKAGGGQQDVSLKVENTVEIDQPAYNVVGKIPGKNHDQQILIAGHYDKYWYGYQDDSMAIAIVLGIAKSMIDAGYQPENDLIFIGHCSEEWGRVGVEADWAQGSWEMISEAHPEWSGKTLACFNYELPALNGGMYAPAPGEKETLRISRNEEIAPTSDILNASELFKLAVPGIQQENISNVAMSQPLADCICYQEHGIPFCQVNCNHGDYDNPYGLIIYHTKNDNEETYDALALQNNLCYSTAWIMQTDKLPAQQMDFALRVAELRDVVSDTTIPYRANDLKAYNAAVDKLEKASEQYTAKVNSINAKYEEAVLSGASDTEIAKIREEGAELNKTSMALFQYLQDEFLAFEGSYDCTIKHAAAQNTWKYLDNMLACFNEADVVVDKDAFAENALSINMGIDKCAGSFSRETCVEEVDTVNCAYVQDTWTAGRQPGGVNVVGESYDVLHAADGTACPDQVKVFKKVRKQMKNALDTHLVRETRAMNLMVKMMEK